MAIDFEKYVIDAETPEEALERERKRSTAAIDFDKYAIAAESPEEALETEQRKDKLGYKRRTMQDIADSALGKALRAFSGGVYKGVGSFASGLGYLAKRYNTLSPAEREFANRIYEKTSGMDINNNAAGVENGRITPLESPMAENGELPSGASKVGDALMRGGQVFNELGGKIEDGATSDGVLYKVLEYAGQMAPGLLAAHGIGALSRETAKRILTYQAAKDLGLLSGAETLPNTLRNYYNLSTLKNVEIPLMSRKVAMGAFAADRAAGAAAETYRKLTEEEGVDRRTATDAADKVFKTNMALGMATAPFGILGNLTAKYPGLKGVLMRAAGNAAGEGAVLAPSSVLTGAAAGNALGGSYSDYLSALKDTYARNYVDALKQVGPAAAIAGGAMSLMDPGQYMQFKKDYRRPLYEQNPRPKMAEWDTEASVNNKPVTTNERSGAGTARQGTTMPPSGGEKTTFASITPVSTQQDAAPSAQPQPSTTATQAKKWQDISKELEEKSVAAAEEAANEKKSGGVTSETIANDVLDEYGRIGSIAESRRSAEEAELYAKLKPAAYAFIGGDVPRGLSLLGDDMTFDSGEGTQSVSAKDVLSKEFPDFGKESAPTPEQVVAKVAESAPAKVEGFERGKAVVRYRARTGEWKETPVRYSVREANDLVTSNTESGGVNEAYPQELQPRDRSRLSSAVQIAQMARDLRPELLGEDMSADRGAPIIDGDGNVISGNGRMLALRGAYKDLRSESGKRYADWLSENAEKFGIDTKDVVGKKSPVLVRELLDKDLDLRAFAEDANVPVVAGMSAAEMAKKDAGRLSPEVLKHFVLNEDGDVLANNEQFIDAFKQAVVEKAEYDNFIDRDGHVSQSGARRIKNALFMKAYGDVASLERMAEATDDDMRNLTNALTQAAPAVAITEERMDGGYLDKSLSLRPAISEAVRTLEYLRDKGLRVPEILNQQNLFGPQMSDAAKFLVKFFDANKRRPKRIRQLLTDYALSVEDRGDPKQMSMFDDGDIKNISVAKLLERAAAIQGLEVGDMGGVSQLGAKAQGKLDFSGSVEEGDLTEPVPVKKVERENLSTKVRKEEAPVVAGEAEPAPAKVEGFERGKAVEVKMPFGGYNDSRYSRPWGARITFEGGRAHYDFNVASYIGDAKDGGDVVIGDARPGDIVAFGQKDKRGGNSVNDWAVVENSGDMRKISKKDAFTLYNRIKKAEEETEGYLDNDKVIRQNGDNNNISNNENGIKEGEKKGDGNGGTDTGGSTASVAVREPEIVQTAEEERPEVAGRGVEGARGDVDGGDKGGDVSGGKSGYDMVRPAAEAADEAAGNAGLAGAVRRTEAGGGSRPGSVGVRGGRNGDAEGDAGRLEESTKSGLSIHDAEFASESVPSSAQSNTHPEKINEEPKLAGENPGNFIITDEVRLGQGTPVDKLKANIEALRILKRVLSEKRYATKEEQTALARYVGWGGLPNAFADKNANSSDAWGNAYRELKSLLSQEEYNAAMMSTRNAHYTPEPIVRAMWRAAEWLGFTRGNVIEPTVGVGNFIGLQPEGMRFGTHWYAAELDMVSGRIASLLYPDADIRVGKGFEYIPFKRGAFDFAIGNPPFASDVTRDHRKLADKKDLVPPMNLHSFIMAKTGDHLRPGGIMEMVITHRFLDTMSNNGARDYLAHNFKLLGAVRLPNDAFKKNAGTDVVTDILFLQKLHVGEAADTKGAWLDADGSVTVDGVTMRVNRYFAEHPENILGRSAMDGKMYSRGRTDGEGEYTVHSDGRDLAAAIDEAVRRSLPQNAFEDKTPADVNLSAAESSASNLSIGGMRLGSDGKVYRRGVNSADGVECIEEITPRTPWKDEAREYQTVIDDLRDMKKAYKEHDDKAYDESASMLVDEDTAFRRGAGGKMKEPKTNAEKALAAVVENISGGARKWVYDSALEEIEKSLERKVLGEGNYRRLQKLLELRNMSLHLMEAERADMKESHLDRLRAELNRAYDAFVKEYGYLGAPENQSVLLDDRGAEQGLEIGYSKGVSPSSAKRYGEKPIAPSALKSGLLTHRVYYPSKEITHVNSVDEGFKVSLNQRGRFDVNYIAGLTGKSQESVIAELTEGEEPRIFFNGDKEAWEDADTYLSGNIRRKLNGAEARGDRKAVAALKKVMPAPKKKENITPSLRGTWVPAQVYADFLSLLGVREPNVVVNPRLGYAAADTASLVQDNELNAKYKNSANVSVMALFNYASSDHAARITMPGPVRGGKPTRVLDEAKTKEVNDLIGELKKDFSRWVYADEARTKTVVDAYNEKMNVMVERKYDGVSHLGEVNGQNPDIRLRDTQKNAAWRMIQTDNVLLDHVVGAGKTFTAITGIMQRKQMGLSRKPLVAVPNHLVSQWASDFYKLYPGANILAISPEEFSKKKRRAFIARMATGDYDAIIVGHSSLRFLENSAKDEQRVIQEQVTLLREAIGFADDDAGDRTVKSLANKTKKYEEKLSSLSENAAKNSDKLGFNFEDMGVDYLVVDEAHEFKNLEYATASDRIVGMNDPNGSMKAWDLYTKVRGIQERGGGVVFATGTPVSNSLVELYTIMKYLGHDELKAQGKLMFDAWKNDYTETETRVEYTPTQEVKERRVLSRLINLNSMQKQYRAFADVISQQDRIVSYKEEMEALNAQDGGKRRTELPIPHVYGGGRQLNIAPKGEVMQQIMDWLVARMKTYEGASSKKAYSSVDNPLWIMTDARIASLDPRTIDPSLPREANGKVMRAAKSIKRLYDKWNAERGTQLVFCDGSVPSDAAKKKAKDKIKEAVEMLYPSNRMKREHENFKYELDRRYNAFSDKWGYIKDAAQKAENEALNEWIEANDSEISAAMNVADSGFSVYNDLKEVLVEMGIPEKEVAFVHDFNGDKKKRELFDKVNRGAIRVLIGSSQKMGAGMNAQERLVGLHHLDAPWRPSDMEQREGRIIRQGNVLYDRDPDHFSVEITAYATEGTNDTVMWTILQRKQAAIDMVRQGREIDVVEEESDAADSYAQFMAQSTGDPVFMKKVEAERDMREKEAEISGIRLARESEKDFLGKYEQEKKLNEARVSELKKSPAESTGVFKEYAAALDAEEKRYQRALAEYEKGKKKYDDDYSRWKTADKDGRGRKPTEPVKPHAPNLFSEGVRNRSKWARDVVSMLTEMNETATRNRSAEDSVVTRSIDIGGSGSVVLTAKPYPAAEGVTAWRAYYALSDGGNFSLFDTVVDVKNPLNSGVLAQALSLTNIAYKQKRLLENFQKRGAELDHKKKSGEELLARKFDEKPVREAVQRFKWYEAMASIAEAKNSAARAERGANPLIENEKMGRALNVSAMKQEEPRTVTIGNEKYETTGVYNKLPSGLLGYEAREAGGERRPVILQAGKSKDNEGHEWLGVIRQPDSVAAEEANEGEAYRLTPRPQSAQARLESDAAAFSKQVDDFIAGKMGRHELFDVMRTPLVLQISDERVKALPVVMTQSTLKKIFSKHNLSPALVKQIPRALADPIMVLDSEMKPGQVREGLIVMLELKDSKGGTINIPIALNSRQGRSYECNVIASVYGRMSATTGKPYNEWFLKQAEKPGLLKYINIKKFSRWVDETGLVLPGRGYNSERLFDILSKIGTDVNAKKFSQWISQAGLVLPGGQSIKRLPTSIKTESDLVKAREADISAYALGGRPARPMPPVTAEMIAPYVPKGLTVKKLPGGQVSIGGPSGFTIVLSNRDEPITPNAEVVKRDYGREPSSSDVVTGRTRIMGRRAFVDFVNGMSSADDFNHELYEIARNVFMSGAERKMMSVDFPNKEAEAEGYKDFMNGRIAGETTGRAARIFRRIRDFFARLRASLFGKRSKDIFRDIAEGRMWKREMRDGADGESYRLVRKGESASPADYVPPVTMKTAKASASGRTAKESTLWGRIAEESGLEAVVKRSEPKNTLKERIIRARDTLEYELFDDLKPLARMFGDDVYDVARYETDGIDAKATALIIDGEPDAGVKGIGRILDGMNPGEIDGFTHYLEWKNLQDVANMTEESMKSVAELEKMAAEEDAAIAVLKKDKDLSQDDDDRKMLDTAIKGREIYAAQLRRQANESRRYIRETRGNSERYAEAVRKLEEAYPDWIEKQKEVAKFNNFVLDEYRKAGVISGELYDFLSKTRPNYVPAQRDFSDVEPGFDGTEAFIRAKGMVNIGEPFRKMKGSKRDIVNPIEGIVKNAYRMTKMRAQQKMANAVLKKVSESGELEGVIKRTKKRDSSPGHHVFYVWELGKKAYYETPDISIYRILTMVDANAADTGIFFSMLANTAKLLRAGVSHSLRFSLWNPERDTMSASVYGTGFRPVIDSIIGMTHAAKKDDVFWDYMRAGGGPSRAFLSDKKLEGIIRELYGATTRNPVTALWNALGRLNEISEQGTRIGVYQRGIECGMTKEDADRLATEATINFNKGGRFSKKVSRYIPFFNSNMQDIYKLYNAHFGKKSKFNPGFKRMAGKGLLMLTLPSMLLWAYNNGSDERRKRYLRIPQWQKNNFWWVVSPDGKKAFPYPKPFALGILYGSMPERILDYIVYKDRRAVEQVMTSLFASLAPGYAPLLIQMMFEQFANKSLFYGREIVPRAEQEIDARLQYGPYTSEWAKYVGKYAGLSPRRVEYATFGILGNLGKEVSTVADDVMRSDVVTKLLDNGNTRAKKDWYEYIPVLNNVIMSTRHFKEPLNAWNSGSGYRRLEGAYKTAKIIYETEGPNALTDKQKLLLVNEQEVKNILRLNSGKDGIWALQRLERRIQMDKSLSSQQKRDEIDKIDEQILLLAEFGLAFISRFEESIKSIEDSMEARREEERSIKIKK